MDLSSQPTLIRGNTTKSIEYTPERRIIIENKTSFSTWADSIKAQEGLQPPPEPLSFLLNVPQASFEKVR